jgi:hypothetical protein
MNPLLDLVNQHNSRFRPIADEPEVEAPKETVAEPAQTALEGRGLYRFDERMPPAGWEHCWVWGTKDSGCLGWWLWPKNPRESWAQDRERWTKLAERFPHWTDHHGPHAPDWTPDL